MNRISRRTWITLILTGFLTASAALLGNIGAGAFTFLSPQIALVLFVLISAMLIVLDLWRAHVESTTEISSTLEQQNRKRMLDLVHRKWIGEYLEDDFRYDEQLLPLSLHKRMAGRWDLTIQYPDTPAQPLPDGTPIKEVYDQTPDSGLLILGDPGCGKTTLLLQLARDLIAHARVQKDMPIPVVLTLSSWAEKREPLDKWLVEELWISYQVPRYLGQNWVERGQLSLLLDGLDEVAPTYQEACIEALNTYRHSHQSPMIVCSRMEAYVSLATRLHLRTAALVQPLTPEHVDTYLNSLGEEVATLRVALRKSETLQGLTTTPFLLRVLILAYHGLPLHELLRLVAIPSVALQQHTLFHAYIERMLRILRYQETSINYSVQQTTHWLTWLAQQMTQRSQAEFYLERIEPNWLPKGWLHFYKLINEFITGLALGLILTLFCGLLTGLLGGPFVWLVGALCVGLIFALCFALAERLLGGVVNSRRGERIRSVEVVRWSWKNVLKNFPHILFTGLIGALGGWFLGTMISGMVAQMLNEKTQSGATVFLPIGHGGIGLWTKVETWTGFRPASALLIGLLIGLLSTLLEHGLSSDTLAPPDLVTPNFGMHRSAQNARLAGLLFAFVGALLGGLVSGLDNGLTTGLSVAFVSGLAAGLVGWIAGGGMAYIQHGILLWLLQRAGVVPRNYIHFLNHAAQCSLLRKVGAGYLFRHRLLQDYFTSLALSPAHTSDFSSSKDGEQQISAFPKE